MCVPYEAHPAKPIQTQHASARPRAQPDINDEIVNLDEQLDADQQDVCCAPGQLQATKGTRMVTGALHPPLQMSAAHP